jgi:hypothetical protein
MPRLAGRTQGRAREHEGEKVKFLAQLVSATVEVFALGCLLVLALMGASEVRRWIWEYVK